MVVQHSYPFKPKALQNPLVMSLILASVSFITQQYIVQGPQCTQLVELDGKHVTNGALLRGKLCGLHLEGMLQMYMPCLGNRQLCSSRSCSRAVVKTTNS